MRLIDADVLNRNIAQSRISLHTMRSKLRVSDILIILKYAPTIDAVPVVRCKDCCKRGGYQCPMYHTETCLDDLDGFDDYNVDRTDDEGFCHLGAIMDGDPDG